MLLALDTSNHQASIALLRESQVLADLSWEVGRQHSQELLDRVQWLFAQSDVRPADLTGVAVARGPGSFNGARVAVTTAKLLAFSLSIPVYGCSTLDMIAYGSASAHGTLLAVMEAGRGELYAAAYVAGVAAPVHGLEGVAAPLAPDLWRIGEPRVVGPEQLVREIEGPLLLCGEWRADTRARLQAAGHTRIRFAPDLGGRHASWLAALAAPRIARGDADVVASLEPLYLRRPAITASARHGPALPTAIPLDVNQSSATEKGAADALCD